MIDTGNAFFILTCARSGSTSLSRILALASNGTCAMEPAPNLNVESRLMMDGRLDDPRAVLRRTILPRVHASLQVQEKYGEKNLTYGPFVRLLYEELGCRFVFLKRDGRDVVRSLLDWHNRKFGTIYREAVDVGDLTPTAVTAASQLPVHWDTSDYSRPRPSVSDPLFTEWERLTRFEMCAYYWARCNDIYVDELSAIPRSAWTELDYTQVTPTEVMRVADFLGLRGLTHDSIASLLDRRVNSLSDRQVTDGAAFPSWRRWPNAWLERFEALAGGTLRRLGYAADE